MPEVFRHDCCASCVPSAQARRPEMDMLGVGGQIVEAIVKLLQDEEAAQA